MLDTSTSVRNARRKTVDDDASLIQNDFTIAKAIGDGLYSLYPAPHLWQVEVQDRMCTIRNLYLSASWGYRYRMTGHWKVDWPEIKKNAGELLERYNLKRGRVSVDDIYGLKRDFAGRVIGDTG